MAWRVGSQKQALFIQFLYLRGGHPEVAIHSTNSRPKRVGTVFPSLSLHHCRWAAPLLCILGPCQVDVSISGTSVDISVGTASRWGGT